MGHWVQRRKKGRRTRGEDQGRPPQPLEFPSSPPSPSPVRSLKVPSGARSAGASSPIGAGLANSGRRVGRLPLEVGKGPRNENERGSGGYFWRMKGFHVSSLFKAGFRKGQKSLGTKKKLDPTKNEWGKVCRRPLGGAKMNPSTPFFPTPEQKASNTSGPKMPSRSLSSAVTSPPFARDARPRAVMIGMSVPFVSVTTIRCVLTPASKLPNYRENPLPPPSSQ